MQARDWRRPLLPILCAFVAVVCFGTAWSLASAQDSGPSRSQQPAQPGNWQLRRVTFHYLGLDSAYSCDALQERLTFLLRQSGARLEAPVSVGPCFRGYGPQRLTYADLKFSILRPATATLAPARLPGSPPAGRWRSVRFSPQHSAQLLGPQDCQLVQEFQQQLLPLFATRDVQARLPCLPNQADSPYELRFEVFAP